jgi:uncharacterized protein (DUF1501 family)
MRASGAFQLDIEPEADTRPMRVKAVLQRWLGLSERQLALG